MSVFKNFNQPYSIKLVGLDPYFDEMVKLFDVKKFPKVLILNGKKGIGKFTLILHFINYIYSKKETTPYNIKDKVINPDSIFYNSFLNNTSQDIIFIHAEENKNIKIDDIRLLKSTLSNSSLSNNPRFTIIDEVEFLNTNSANALLKTLEEPSDNNFFLLINNQQADLLETISSRCLKNNIFLNSTQRNNIINYLTEERGIKNLIDTNNDLSPGLFLKFNKIYIKYKINKDDNISIKLNTLISGYKKDKDKTLISLAYFLIDCSFFQKIKTNKNNIEYLLNTKSSIINIINEFVQFNLNINSVLNSIKINLKNV
jgi:DNA polymerase-3 subunit delta'|tara:strand:+ start:45 stop:986 length:942 start_codon:yes stop_codon:yes gene_type:complete